MTIESCSITDIKDWMLNPESNVELPPIQRGFVWKPFQIENLWDSIFRGFPIGSFLLTSTGDKKMLLDGQQRATSIALGFYNPWDDSVKSLGNAKNLPVIWIDVSPSVITEKSEYVFRVVTRSHPWGYQLIDNHKVLCVSDRIASSNSFKTLYGEKMYTKLEPNQRLPFDATLPVPLCFLLESMKDGIEYKEWKDTIIEKCSRIPTTYRPKHLPNILSYIVALDECDLESLFDQIKAIRSDYLMPATTIPNELITKPTEESDVDPTLFVRLNSEGIRLEGEELIYSIYKAVFPATKELVERVSTNVISPSRIISLASRLVLSNLRGQYYNKLTLSQFQREIGKADFREALEVFIGDNTNSRLSTLFSFAIDILNYDSESPFPAVIIKRFIKDSPSGFLLLLNWLYHNDIDSMDSCLKKAICAKLYTYYWFGNMEAIVNNSWDQSREKEFWSKPYRNSRLFAWRPLVSPDELEAFLLNSIKSPEEDLSISAEYPELWTSWTAAYPKPDTMKDEDYLFNVKEAWINYIYRFLGNRYLVLLAQKEYINETYKDFNQIDDLQDTETPWDWDHIYPKSWVEGRWYIDRRTKNWEWRIGNYRAMSLTDNRSENSNMSPMERFEGPNKDFFIKENDYKYWRKLDSRHKSIKDTDNEYVSIHAKAIIIRTVNIYRLVYDYFSFAFE